LSLHDALPIYETRVLIGPLDAGSVVIGSALSMLYLVFVVALVTAVAQRARTVIGTVMVSILILLLLPIFGISEAVGRWLPSHLASSLAALSAGEAAADCLPAAAVTVVVTAGLWWLALELARRREL